MKIGDNTKIVGYCQSLKGRFIVEKEFFMRQAFYFLILPFLASCAFVPDEWLGTSVAVEKMSSSARSYTILPPPPSSVFTGSQTIYQNNYVLNETMSAKVGETVLRVKAFKRDNFVSDELRLEKPVTIKIGHQQMVLPAKKYEIFGIFEQGDKTYFVLPKYKHFYFLVDMDGVLQRQFLYEIKGSDKATMFPEKAQFFPESARMKRELFFEQAKIPFLDFEVVYDGIKNNQIVLFYKDAVPGTDGGSGSFDTLGYPADSTMISVAGRLLRVLRADKEQISYIVVKE